MENLSTAHMYTRLFEMVVERTARGIPGPRRWAFLVAIASVEVTLGTLTFAPVGVRVGRHDSPQEPNGANLRLELTKLK